MYLIRSSKFFPVALSFLLAQAVADQVCPIEGPSIPYGTASSFDGTIAVGTEVMFTCLSDWMTTMSSVCEPNGAWSYPNGTCPGTCPMNGPDGPMGTMSSFDGTNAIGTNVTFTCKNDGYTMFYSHCDEYGSWTPVYGMCCCPSSGPMVPHDMISMFDGTNSVGTMVGVKCANDMDTMFYSECMSDGSWSYINGSCPMTCPMYGPDGPMGTTSSFDGTNAVGTNVTFTCMSDGTTMFYSHCDEYGSWTPVSGACSCPYPKDVMPYDAFGSFADSYPIGTNISFTCSSDLTTQVYSTCQCDGTWSPIYDACPSPCPPYPMGPYDTTSSFCGDNRIGSSVSFTCNSDNITMFYSQCQSDGTWSSNGETCTGGSEISGPSPSVMTEAIQGMNVLSDVNPCMYFKSPNWPADYTNTNIVWTFESHATSDCSNPMLETVFDPNFNMIANKKCNKGDRLEIPYPNSKGSMEVCGSTAPVVPPTTFSSGDVLSFNFIAEKKRFAVGFKATVCLTCENSLIN